MKSVTSFIESKKPWKVYRRKKLLKNIFTSLVWIGHFLWKSVWHSVHTEFDIPEKKIWIHLDVTCYIFLKRRHGFSFNICSTNILLTTLDKMIKLYCKFKFCDHITKKLLKIFHGWWMSLKSMKIFTIPICIFSFFEFQAIMVSLNFFHLMCFSKTLLSNVYPSLHGKIHYKKLSKPFSSLQTVFFKT
jgi:hypothetical protein